MRHACIVRSRTRDRRLERKVGDAPQVRLGEVELHNTQESAALANIQAVRPGMQVFRVSAKTGIGMNDFLQFPAQRRSQRRATAL